MAMIKCPECGKEVSDQADQCVLCGYVLKTKKKMGKLPIIAGAAVVLLLALFVIIKVFLGKGSDAGYFDNNKWGMTYDEVQEKYGDDISESDLAKGTLAMYGESYNKVEGLDYMVQLGFDKNNELNSVWLIIVNSDSDLSDSEAYDMIVDELSKTYGKAEEVKFGFSWETDKSIISAKQYPGSTDGVMVIYEKSDE